MPRYFFDICDGDDNTIDLDGTELPDLHAARDEATETLTNMASDFLPCDGPHRSLSVRVRDESGVQVLEAGLTFAVNPPV